MSCKLSGEQGILVHEKPNIMRSTQFHSYVPLIHGMNIHDQNMEDSYESIPDGVLNRIIEYLSKNNL